MTSRGPIERSPSEGDAFSLSSSFDGGAFVIEAFGELDLATAPELQLMIERAESTDAREIVLDLSGLEFIDSTGIAVLIEAARRSNSGQDRLRMLRGTGQVEQVLRLCRLHDRLPFAD